ncbi:MAG: G5 domain-containing protein, partial [Chloroflexi bacterium]|nr:G5 domain-containing protein [Chloroflexota bacterium]
TTINVTIVADSKTTTLTTKALTVRDALSEASITLGQIDKVTPSEFTPLTQDTTITIVRVTEKFDVEEVIVPFEKQTVRNEGLPASESRLLQTGVNGKDEITYRTVFENGVQTSRAIVRRVSVKQPLAEIVMVGSQTTFIAIPITGTLSYLSAGNAWLMRLSSGSRKPLTTSGDLDGRVFSLAPDGKYLLYTRTTVISTTAASPTSAGLSNSLWAISINDPNAKPFDLKVKNVLWADWSPTAERTLAYTTAEPRATAPGWQANNDLFVLTFSTLGNVDKSTLALEASSGGVYGWFGTRFTWSPDGSRLAFSQADKESVHRLDTRWKIFIYRPSRTAHRNRIAGRQSHLRRCRARNRWIIRRIAHHARRHLGEPHALTRWKTDRLLASERASAKCD